MGLEQQPLDAGADVLSELHTGKSNVRSPYKRALVFLAAIGISGLSGCSDDGTGPGEPASVIITGPSSARQGDVTAFTAEARDASGTLVNEPSLTWSVEPNSAGLITEEGEFVGYASGSATIVVSANGVSDVLQVTIDTRALSGSFGLLGRGIEVGRFTSDLWVHGNYAYTGTWAVRGPGFGNALFVWDISTPAAPVRTDSVKIDAITVNDVKVRADGAIAVLTHENSGDGLNGITLLDLADPAHPTVITRYTDGLEAGVHNVWVEGSFVYAALDSSDPTTGGPAIIDISTPAVPQTVARFYAGSSFLHDVYVRDGLAFRSHWDAGLVILDVGNGVAGGSPASPTEVGRIVTAGGQTHNAWYWPQAGYVFVGEEDFGTPGIVHVVDVSDLGVPVEVASFSVTGTTPHNFWMDETRGILYVAWYETGIRALDVSSRLSGELDRQGREYTALQYDGPGGGCVSDSGTCSWAPQLHDGLIYLSDQNSGLWVFATTISN